MTQTLVTVVPTVLAVFIGYALGVYHTRRAVRDAIEELEKRRQ